MKIIPTYRFIICANFIRPPNNLRTINTAICADSRKPDLKNFACFSKLIIIENSYNAKNTKNSAYFFERFDRTGSNSN